MSASVPWLSVLIPVYNVEAYLAECVQSVLQQADAGVEVIILDDCSSDASLALMHTLSDRWPGRLRLMQHGHNGGLSAARNTMIDAARGDYLWFLDSDDKLLPGALAELQSIVRNHVPDLVLCDFQVWREKSRLRHRLRGEAHRTSFAGTAGKLLRDRSALLGGMLMTGQLHAWSKISRRALWTPDLRFPLGRYFEDMATMPLLALKAASFYYQPSPWVAYRQRASSILATMTLPKAMDQSRALVELRHALVVAACEDNAALRFALAHQSARNLIGAMRFLSAHRQAVAQTQCVAEVAEHIRQNFRASSLLSAQALEKSYLLRGWWLRWQKFHRWFHCFQR